MDHLALLGFAIAMSVTPGPNVLMVAAGAANAGVRATVPHMVGIAIGFGAMLLIVAGLWQLIRGPSGRRRGLPPAVLPHHRAYGSVHGGS